MNEPDYGTMTLSELRDIERHVDGDAYPERHAEVQRQITLREQGIGPGSKVETRAEQQPSGPNVYAVRFTGSGGEYFRIWIVNLLLSLVTLGIYSAWATVRNRRYLYGNVELDGSRLDFHGSPLAILKGRVLAVLLFVAYAFGGDFHFAIPLTAILVLLVGFPWIMVSALRFRLSNTSWKSLRFGFAAKPSEAYRLFIFPVLLLLAAYAGMIAFAYQGFGNELPQSFSTFIAWVGVILVVSAWVIPVLNYRARKLIMNNVYFGDHPFSATLKGSVFFSAFFQAFGLGLALLLVLGILVAGLIILLTVVASEPGQDTIIGGGALVVVYAISIPIYLLPFALWHVKTTNHVFSSTRLEGTTFHMSMQVFRYWGILVSNAIVAVLSLGLAIPWAKVRMLRYRLGCLLIEGRLSGYAGVHAGSRTATGDEIGQAFDIDFGF